MKTTKNFCWVLLSTFWSIVFLVPNFCNAEDEELLDLIAPIGNFEKAGLVYKWQSGYYDNTFDWKTYSPWLVTYEGSYKGTNLASENDNIAIGWTRRSGINVNPQKNLTCYLTKNPNNETKCQYFAVSGLDEDKEIYAALTHGFKYARYGLGARIGDTLVFVIDYVKVKSPYALRGNYITYIKCVTFSNGNYKEVINKSFLKPFLSPLTAKVELKIPENTIDIEVGIIIEGKLQSKKTEAGIYIDDAHLYLRKSGKTDLERFPKKLKKNPIKTIKIDYGGNDYDEIYLAKYYDIFIVQRLDDASYIQKIKWLNPNAKFYLYCSSHITKLGNGPKDPYEINSAMGYYESMSKNTRWFYKSNVNDFVMERRYNTYYANLQDETYQKEWARNAIFKAIAAGYDGIFIDFAVPFQSKLEDGHIIRPQIEPWQIQKFMKGILPEFNKNNLKIVWNACLLYPDEEDGATVFSPFWKPDEKYKKPDYSANNFEDTPSIFFQEWAFFYPNKDRSQIIWDKKHWKKCIDDMSAIKKWNEIAEAKGISKSYYKYYFCSIQGVESMQSPSNGEDGWINFALASYLLGCNEYTAFGCARIFELGSLDITNRLGIPAEGNFEYENDTYLRYRLFYPGNGGNGGVVVVNGNTDLSRDYKTPFDTIIGNKIIPKGTNITIPPKTGRILIKAP